MKNKLTAWLCLLSLLCSLLSGCGESTSVETEAPATEPAVTTEPTTEPVTAPTEPKTFFEEQGFEFWEGFKVYDTLDEEGNRDGGLFAEANILDSAECKVTITSGNREETTYCLADTKVDVVLKEYSLAEFDEACKNDKLLRTENIKNASDSLYKAFKEEDNSLTKEAWLEQYRDYKVICGQIEQTIRIANEVNNSKLEMRINSQSQWYCKWYFYDECLALMNCFDGSVFESEYDDYPGVAEVFEIITASEVQHLGTIVDTSIVQIDSGGAKDVYLLDYFFVMVPNDLEDLAFILPLLETERTLGEFEEDLAAIHEISENPWEQKTFAEYTEGKEYLKYYFLSPYHH